MSHPLFDPATFPVAPGRRRVIAAFDVTDDELDKHDLALILSCRDGIDDPTVWEWKDFWLDVDDDQVSRDHDFTSVRNNDCDG